MIDTDRNAQDVFLLAKRVVEESIPKLPARHECCISLTEILFLQADFMDSQTKVTYIDPEMLLESHEIDK